MLGCAPVSAKPLMSAHVPAVVREHAVATARAAALRDRRLPPLQKALDTVRAELAGGQPR